MVRFYVLCVFPDGSPRPIGVSSNRVFNVARFLAACNFPDHSLYIQFPSWLERLPDDQDFVFPDIFSRNPALYRLQFLPSTYPMAFIRFEVTSEKNIAFHPWNIVLAKAGDLTFADLLAAFAQSFCVETDSMELVSSNASIDLTAPIVQQRDTITQASLTLKLGIPDKSASQCKHRMEILHEILTTESSYVAELGLTAEHFTEEFFAKMDLPPDFFRRTFKSVSEIRPVHVTFLQTLETVGSAPESCIGAPFLQYVPYFKIAAPHVSNFASSSAELRETIKTNKALGRAIWQICEDVFGGKTVDSLLVTPVQRIPRYPLLLRDLIKATPEKHWDYEHLVNALAAIQKVNKQIDDRAREQANFLALMNLQEKFGNACTIVTRGRRIVKSVESFKATNDTSGSLHLFSDLLIYHQQLPTEQFFEFDILRTKLFIQTPLNGKPHLVITPKLQAPDVDHMNEFLAAYQTTRRDYVLRMCTFDGALSWSPGATGAPRLQNPGMVSIFKDLYLFGGRREGKSSSNELWFYRDGVWRNLQTVNPPPPRFDCSLDVYQERLILFGGQDGSTIFGDLWQFHIPSMTWEQLTFPNAPSPRFAHATAFSTTQLWLFGGKNQDVYLSDFYCCDLHDRSWFHITTETEPEPRAWHTAFWVVEGGNWLFSIYGGASRSSALTSVWFFDWDAGDWYAPALEGEPLGGRFAHVSVVIDSNLYIIGGRNMTSTKLEAYKVDLSHVPYKTTLIPQADEPDSFAYGCCAVLANFGLALYCEGVWMIRLTAEVVVPEKPRAKPMPESGPLSTPIYNPATGMVTAALGDPSSKFSFDSQAFDIRKLESISRIVNGVWKWRAAAVISATDEVETDDDAILSEEAFAPNSPKKTRVRAATRLESLMPELAPRRSKTKRQAAEVPLRRHRHEPNPHFSLAPLDKQPRRERSQKGRASMTVVQAPLAAEMGADIPVTSVVAEGGFTKHRHRKHRVDIKPAASSDQVADAQQIRRHRIDG
jgi:hypothetical protein